MAKRDRKAPIHQHIAPLGTKEVHTPPPVVASSGVTARATYDRQVHQYWAGWDRPYVVRTERDEAFVRIMEALKVEQLAERAHIEQPSQTRAQLEAAERRGEVTMRSLARAEANAQREAFAPYKADPELGKDRPVEERVLGLY